MKSLFDISSKAGNNIDSRGSLKTNKLKKGQKMISKNVSDLAGLDLVADQN